VCGSGDSVTDPQLHPSNDDVARETDAEPTAAADCQEQIVINDPPVAVEELNNSDINAAPRAPHPGLVEALEILQLLSPHPGISKPREKKWKMESA